MAVDPWNGALWNSHQRARWGWADHALDDAFEKLTGRPIDRASRHVTTMLVGDSQAGKTCLAIQVLGVVDPEHAEEVHDVLRAGREVGRSSTSFPVRYGWSSDETGEFWEFTDQDGPEFLDSTALTARLAGFRDRDGGTLWDVERAPVAIGVPRRYGHRERAVGAEVLDLLGLFAQNPDERALARRLVDRFSPTVSRVAFVVSVNKMYEAFKDAAIQDNHHLADWKDNPERYMFVFTRSFTDTNGQDILAGLPSGTGTDEALALLRDWQVTQFAGTHAISDRAPLLDRCFPIELGGSWRGYPSKHPDTHEIAGRVNAESLAQLRSMMESGADTSSFYRAAMNVRGRVVLRVRRAEAAREQRIGVAMGRLERAAGDLRLAQDAHAEREAERVAAATALTTWKTAVSRLSGRSPRRLPDLPIAGVVTRLPDRQLEEKAAYAEDARAIWQSWYDETAAALQPVVMPVEPLLPVKASEIRDKYDSLMFCRIFCSWWCSSRVPAVPCYKRMVSTGVATRAWVTERFTAHAREGTPRLEAGHQVAHTAAHRARALAMARVTPVEEAEASLDEERREAAAERENDRDALAMVNRLAGELHAANHASVTEMIGSLPGMTEADQIVTAVAALRLLMDLDDLVGRR
ncbi:hypothetical protein [Sphaerisporangium dianthi]|uniref:Uncharacterized protein n=1 Tax=Sphaerisporangium dianthi TaxID=1436120 RepID=A0ABV9CD36_9ACTN